MIPVKRNHFYTKEIISNAVGVHPQFKDLTGGSAETTLVFKGGIGASQYVVSGNVSSTPPYGDSELRGGYLQTYITGMALSGTNTFPSLSAYKLQNGLPISEGGFNLSSGIQEVRYSGDSRSDTTGVVGDRWWVSESQLAPDDIWLEENFDGTNKSLGSGLNMPAGGGNMLTMDDAFVTAKEGAEIIWAGGDAFFGGGGSNSVEHNLTKYFAAEKGGTGGSTAMNIYVRPYKKNRTKGLWTSRNDWRKDDETWKIYQPFWKWETIKGSLQFAKESVTTADEGAETEATTNNTIFNKLYQNGAGRGGMTGILSQVTTSMNLVPSEDGGIGQSMKWSCDWASGPEVGAEGNMWTWSLNSTSNAGGYVAGQGVPAFNATQTQWASIYDIPYPLPNNIGAISQTSAASGAMAGGDQRIGFPEIELNMKIDSLLPSPALKLNQEAMSDDTKLMCGTNIEIFGTRVATNQINTTGATGELLIGSVVDILKSSKTFWRSIVITFSNYKPEDVGPNCTFEQFITYGLEYAYGGKTRDEDVVGIDKYQYEEETTNGHPHLGHTIVGGLVFQSMYDQTKPNGYLATLLDGPNMGAADEGVVYAYTLPVARFARGTGYNNEAPLMRVTGSNTTDPDFAPTGALVHKPDFHVQGPVGTRGAYPYVKIPKEEFFKVKFVWDVQQPWTYNTSDGWYLWQNTDKGTTSDEPYGDLGSDVASGVPLRAYFPDTKTAKPFGSAADNPPPDDKIPYINIAFPAEDDANASYYMCDQNVFGESFQGMSMHKRRGGSNYFPKHMTIWVNGVGVAPASTSAWWGGNATFFDNIYWTADDRRYAITGNRFYGPTPISTQLSIDTIEFKNWVAPSTNISAGAGTFSRFLKGLNTPILSPAAKYTSGSNYTKSFGADGTLNPIAPGQTITFGAKGKVASGGTNWLPVVNTTAGAGGDSYKANNGYLLFNNFSSKAFGQLEKTYPSAAWISTADESDDATMGDFGAYPGMEMAGILHVTGTKYRASQGANSKVFVETGSTDDPDADFSDTNPVYTTNPYICMGYGGEGNWLGTDGLTQKGFMKIAVSSGSSKWVPRENVLTSAKIMAVAGSSDKTEDETLADKNILKVDNIDLFHLDLDDDYVIYRAGLCNSLGDGGGDENPIGQGFEVDDATTDSVEVTGGSNRVADMATSSQVGSTITGDNIPDNTYIAYRSSTVGYLNKNIPTGSLSDGSTATITATVNPAAHTACGYKYTVKLIEKDVVNSTIKLQVLSGSTVLDQGIAKADDDTTDLCVPQNLSELYISPKRFWLNMTFSDKSWDTERKYENMCMVAETPATGSISTQLGSTYNEALYTYNTGNMATKGLAAILEKPWILGVSDDSTLILNEDYGYGSYDDDKNEGGEASRVKPVLNTHAYFPLEGMVETITPAPEEEISLVVGINDEINTSEITVVADDTALDTSGSTYYRPQYVWEYYDGLPEVSGFEISPQFDVLSPDIDLYGLSKQQINNLRFKWSENGEDIWYRHLLIDTSGSIENKYHRSSFWAPMNTSSFNYYLNDVTDLTTTQTFSKFSGTAPQLTVDGISGYAPYFKNSSSSGDGSPCYILGDYTTTTGSYNEMKYSMSNEMGGSLTSNPWKDKWSLVVHCWPDTSNAPAQTQSEGMTVCGVVCPSFAYQAPSGSSGTGEVRITMSSGNSAPGYNMQMDWDYNSSQVNTEGGFDVLHVYIKDSKVNVLYCHEYYLRGYETDTRPFGSYGNYEAMILTSKRTFKMDGTEPLAITIVYNNKKGANITSSTSGSSTSVTSNDQFQLYVNGQLEDSESVKYNSTTDAAYGPYTDMPDIGGFGRSNYTKFVVGSINGGSEWSFDGKAGCTNVVAPVGEEVSSNVHNYRMSRNSFQGKIEEIILYPYEVYVPTNGGEYILNTRTLDDYSSSGTSAHELNYTGRLFLYDYTNVRGKSADQVSSSNQVQWKVTGT